MNVSTLQYAVDYGIIGLLLVLSVIAVAIGIERIWFFRNVSLRAYDHAKELELEASRGLGVVASIGSNAPYIGLLGTVLSIMMTFYAMGQSGGEIETGVIMRDLALALKATAAGLLVAIPTTALYNGLSAGVDRVLARWEILRDRKEESDAA
jgi:biopolymer transport protein ExbB